MRGFERGFIHKMPESVNEKITFRPMSGLILAISVGFKSTHLADSLSLIPRTSQVWRSGLAIWSVVLICASTTANPMDVDPGIDEATFRPSSGGSCSPAECRLFTPCIRGNADRGALGSAAMASRARLLRRPDRIVEDCCFYGCRPQPTPQPRGLH
jgi:hypothetical protein